MTRQPDTLYRINTRRQLTWLCLAFTYLISLPPLWGQTREITIHAITAAKGTVVTECDPIELIADKSLGRQRSKDYAVLCRATLTSLERKWKAKGYETKIVVYITPTTEEYTRLGGDASTSAGFATYIWWYKRSTPMQFLPTAVVDGARYPDFVPTSLRHEMAHLATLIVAAPNAEVMPIWFMEGIASLHETGADETAFAAETQASADQEIPTLAQIDTNCTTHNEQMRAAYTYAADLVAYGERTYGSDWVGRILLKTRDGSDFESAVRAASTGKDINTIADEWRKDLDRRARKRAAKENGLVLGVLLTIVAVIGGITWLVSRATRGRALGTIVETAPDGHTYYTTDDRKPMYMSATISGVESMADADPAKRRETMRQHALQAIEGTINWPVFYSAWSGVAITDPIQRTTYWNLLDLHEKSPGFPFKPGINYKHPDTRKMLAGLRLDVALLAFDIDPRDLEQIRADCINVPESEIESEVARRVADRADRIHPHEIDA